MKLVEVMACIDRVAKNGVNASQGYSYAQASDIYDAVRTELARRFVLPCPNPTKWDFLERDSRSGGKLIICTVQGTLDFVDAETGETVSRPMFGQGSDSLDKASYKAMTGAMKNAIVHQFLIPTGDDPENEKPAKPQPPPPPAGLASVKAKMPQAAPPANPQHRDHQTTQRAPQSGLRADHDRTLVYPFGSDKGKSISDVEEKSLRYWEGRMQKELADPSQAKWHARASQQLAVVQAELSYRLASATASAMVGMAEAGGGPNDEPPPLTDDDAPH